MNMQLRDLTFAFGIEKIFENVNIIINENEHVGIVGVNGAGKTTLFKLITKELVPDSGRIILKNNARVQLLPQVISDEVPNMDITVFDYLLEARPIDKLTAERIKIYENLSVMPDQMDLYKKLEKIEKELDYWEYYSAEGTLLKIINGMNINDDMLYQKLNKLSGGQKSKVAFAKLLYSKPEIILLDEPTNHLDKETKEYVVNYIKNYKGTVLIISHDKEFLDSVTNKTLYIDKLNKSMEMFNGSYSVFLRKIEERKKQLEHQAEIEQREEEKLKKIVYLYSNSSGNRKKMAQDREKKLEKLLKNKIVLEPKMKETKLKLEMKEKSELIPLKVEKLTFGYDTILFKNLTFALSRGEKFLVVGINGIGKSTLLKLVVGILKPISGNIVKGDKTIIGYYAQEHEGLNLEKTILENFDDLGKSERELRNLLGRFLFYGDDVFKKVKYLSPGERSRVALARLAMIGANLLILDEPTNHLDPKTQEIIADVFKDYEGTMLVVSHNINFTNNLNIDRMLYMQTGEICYYDKEKVKEIMELNTR